MVRGAQRLRRAVRSLPLAEGGNATAFSFLTVYRFTTGTIQMPQTESFYLYVVVDGSLRLFTPSGILDYVPGQYSVSKIDTPNAGHVQAFSQEGDFLALAIEFTPNDVISVVLDLEGGLAQEIADGTVDSGVMERADRAVLSSICRLLSAAREPPQLSFMGKQILREILFYVLCGTSGSQFLRSVVNFQQAGEIYAANSWIKENFRSSFTVEELAERRNMSVSQFHQKFKNAVGMGPLQCQKRLRLTEGRCLMLDEEKMSPRPLWTWAMRAPPSSSGTTGKCSAALPRRRSCHCGTSWRNRQFFQRNRQAAVSTPLLQWKYAGRSRRDRSIRIRRKLIWF